MKVAFDVDVIKHLSITDMFVRFLSGVINILNNPRIRVSTRSVNIPELPER